MSSTIHPVIPSVFLIFLLLPLSLSSPSRTNPIPPSLKQQNNDTRPTIAAILDPDLTDNNKPCCNDFTPYDIFARLVHQADLFQLLQAPNPITLFAANDLAVNQTAEDLAPLLDYPFAQSESDAYSLITLFFNQFQQPDALLKDVILFHILKQSQSLHELLNGRHETFLPDQFLESFGTTLHPSPRGIILAENVQLIIGPDSDVEARNGFFHTVDRIIFPDLSRYPLKPSSSLTRFFSTSLSPRPTTIPGTNPPPNADDTVLVNFPPPSSASPSASPSPSPSPSIIPQTPQSPACFSASALVTLHDRTQFPLLHLHAGQHIMANEHVSSPVYLFTHRQPTARHRFIRITTRHNHTIILSPGHLLYANGRLTPASHVSIGHILRTLDGPSTVVSARWILAEGLFAPHTIHGDIVVNRVIASTYTTAVNPTFAHAFLWPVRAVVQAGLAVEPLGTLFYDSHFAVVPLLRKWRILA